ncbi:hypothetical protein, partial [Mesorhizobium sp.]|uniref:hypothetical protein n=1 Tax=Mesorhizobium sp. TaxID=1871066 RepID=UPI0025BAA915
RHPDDELTGRFWLRVLAALRLRARGRYQGQRRVRHPDDELTGRFWLRVLAALRLRARGIRS